MHLLYFTAAASLLILQSIQLTTEFRPINMTLAESIHPVLADADYSRASVKIKFIGLSFAFFSVVYLISELVANLSVSYRKLRRKEKTFWNLAVVRGVFGIFCIKIGIWAFFFDEELPKDVVFGTTQTSYWAMTVTVGFFLFECSMLLWSDIYYRQFNLLLNIHHWLSLVGYSILLYNDSTHYFGCRGLILEMSTPFSCLCWTLLKADMADSFLWKANQFLLVHTFHLRSVVECTLWYETYKHWDVVWATMPWPMFSILYIQLFLVTFIMTPYWTYKKTVQMINPVDWNFEDSKKKAQNGYLKRD